MRQFKTYQHYKGGIYTVLCEAKDHQTMQPVVVYVCAVSGEVFVRLKTIFDEVIEDGDYKGPRFIALPEVSTKEQSQKLKWF